MSGRTLAIVGSLNREAPYFQGARGKGIAVLDFDERSGKLSKLSEKGGVDNPTYLTLNEGNRCVYATSEVFGWNEGTVSAYRLDPATGTLAYINKQASLGSIIAYASIDRGGRYLLAANYSVYAEPADSQPDQAAVVFPIHADGGLGAPVASVAHQGSGPDAARQERSHAHCIMTSPDNRHVIVNDLGIDKVMVYRFDAATGKLRPGAVPFHAVTPGAGPRHFAFHPSGRFAYAINELNSTITALAYDADKGSFAQLQAVPALPADYHDESHCADLHVSPDGKFVYGSNRGHDSIAIHAIDAATGRLTLVGHQSTLGKTPRNFAISPSGDFLVAANQNSDTLVVFRIDRATGKLVDTGQRAEIGTPMCVKFGRF